MIYFVVTIVALLRFLCFVASVPVKNDSFEVNIIHINDFHARFEEFSKTASACRSDDCIGGFSRIYTTITQLAKSRPNSLVLNGGDNFQGTLWYNIFRWNVTQYFLNLLPFDAYVLGNHEFDHGIAGLVPFMRTLKAPIVVSNIDDSDQAEVQGLYQKSIIVERDGRKIGIIGVISKNTNILSSTENITFLNESSSVNEEAERIKNNVDTIIVLSHCGYEADKIIAKSAAEKISLIVGGHSHTFLYTGSPLPGPEVPSGPYPTVVTHQDGRKILIVQASALGKYVGNLTVKFDKEGKARFWSGAPIYLNASIQKDPLIDEKLKEWRLSLEEEGNRYIGQTNVLLQHSNCRYSECNLGNLITDAMVFNYHTTVDEQACTSATIALINSGGIKTSINPGNITFSDLVLALPFGNTFDLGEIQGKYLKAALEFAGSNTYGWGRNDLNLLQVSGLHVIYNVTKHLGSRIESVKVRCKTCKVPLYEDLVLDRYYKIVINSFLAKGGEGHEILLRNIVNKKVGELDTVVLEKYLKKFSPIVQEIQGRIQIVN